MEVRKKSRWAVRMGRRGGRATNARLTAEERSLSASRASRARYAHLPRCACGKYTARQATLRKHVCELPAG